jgi:hypothetical protein
MDAGEAAAGEDVVDVDVEGPSSEEVKSSPELRSDVSSPLSLNASSGSALAKENDRSDIEVTSSSGRGDEESPLGTAELLGPGSDVGDVEPPLKETGAAESLCPSTEEEEPPLVDCP